MKLPQHDWQTFVRQEQFVLVDTGLFYQTQQISMKNRMSNVYL